MLLQVNHPIKEKEGLHQGGQQESKAEEDHHLPLLGRRGWLQGPAGAHPDTLQSPASIPAREGKAALAVPHRGLGGAGGCRWEGIPTSWGRRPRSSRKEVGLAHCSKVISWVLGMACTPRRFLVGSMARITVSSLAR